MTALSLVRPIALTVERTEAGFDALASDWDRLFQRAGLSVFQSFEWNRAWWRAFAAPNSELHVVTVRDGDELIGIAPLLLEHVQASAVRVRRLAFLGRDSSDYLDFIVAPERRREIVDLLAGHFVDHSDLFDVAVLDEVSDRSSTITLLADALAHRGMPTNVFANERCPRTTLLKTWDETIASWQLEHRRELRRRLRNFRKVASLELEVGGSPATVEADIDEFIEMHQDRWTSQGHMGALAVDAIQRFHKEVARAFASRGWAFFGFLRVDGRKLCVVYGFRFRGELAIYLTGMREGGELRRHSPGRVLAGMCMEHAVTEGLSAYDFMRGGEQYKYELAGVDVMNRTLTFYGCRAALPGPRHRLVLLGHSLRRRAQSEVLLWRHATKSTSAVEHLRARARVVVRDG